VLALASGQALGSVLRSVSVPSRGGGLNLPPPTGGGATLADQFLAELRASVAAERAAGVHRARRRRLLDLLDSYRAQATGPWRELRGVKLPPRLACCGLQRHEGTTALLALGEASGNARTQWAGVIRCRSKACPFCLGVRKMNDARVIERVCADHHDAFNLSGTYLGTFTMRNQIADNLGETWRGVSHAFSKMLGTRAWAGSPSKRRKNARPSVRRRLGLRTVRGWTCRRVGERERLGLSDFVVGQETTFGLHGWHCHLHALFLPRREPYTDREIRRVRRVLFCLWSRAVRRVLGRDRMPSYMRRDEHGARRFTGVDFRPCKRDEYLAKLGLDLGRELADPGLKVARVASSRAPLELLADWCDAKDSRALLLYQVFERASRNTKDLTWSKGLRPFRDLARHELREEWLRERATARTLVTLPGEVSDALARMRGALCDVQDAAEKHGTDGAVRVVTLKLGEAAGASVAAMTLQHEEARAVVSSIFEAANTREWFAG